MNDMYVQSIRRLYEEYNFKFKDIAGLKIVYSPAATIT